MVKVFTLLLIIYASASYGRIDYDRILEQADRLRTSAPKQSLNLLENIDISQLTKSQIDLYHFVFAGNQFTFGTPDKARKLLVQLLENEPLDATRIKALIQLIIIYTSTHDWPEAIRTVKLLKAELSASPELDATIREEAEFKIFDFYNQIGEHQHAKNLGIDLMVKARSPRIQCVTKTNLLNSYMETTPEKIGPEDFYQAKVSCQSLKDPMLDNIVNAYFAKYYLIVDKPEEALEVLSNNLSSVKSTLYQALIASFHELMASAYLAKNDFEQAEKYALLVLNTIQQHQYEPSISAAYKVMAEVTKQARRFEQALNYQELYTDAKQLNLDQENAKILALQKAQFDDLQKGAQLALLDKENALLKTQALLNREADYNKRLALALLSIVLVVFILWTYKNRRNYLRMQHYAQVDELTGIANRHYFNQQANTAIKYCARSDKPVSFIIFDLDYFKRVNDTYGHQTGDIVLKVAVDAVNLACRKNDIIGRLGGEEFGILLPGCALHLATFIAEKCRKAIANADYSPSGYNIELTASFGIADSSTCDYNFEKLFAGADVALYQSKDLGRDRVIQHQI
jgi:diguanylate cyclase (GGDEF)-like protein